jgi:hypothetical protein
MMMMRTGRIPVSRVVEGALLAMGMTVMKAIMNRTDRAVRMGPGKGREHRMRRGKGTLLRT